MSLRVGASAEDPGLTVRWVRGSLVARRGSALATVCLSFPRRWFMAPSYFVADKHGHPTSRERFRRHCDAKRAAEVLVGQWWREAVAS